MSTPRQIARRAFRADIQRMIDGEISPTSPMGIALVGIAAEFGIELPERMVKDANAAMEQYND